MVPAADAEALILDLVTPFSSHNTSLETVALSQALGRVLGETVTSPLDFPHWDNSAMDGYAVRHTDVHTASADAPVTLTVVAEIPAGRPPQITLQSGQAARILTGAMMPPGADTVVIQEVTTRQGDRVTITEAPRPQQFVRHQGAFHQAGTPLLSSGTLLGASELAVLAAAQCPQVPVYRRPQVAILSTGSELVTPDHPLQPGQIVDSNAYALAALVQQTGAIPVSLGIVPDQPDALRATIATALAQADVVISSGGVSVGDYDYVDRILAEVGATLHLRAVAVKPGKPLTVATAKSALGSTLYFGLPGNPVSALVSFWRFVAPALRKLAGRGVGWSPLFLPAITDHLLRAGGQRETYLWGHLHPTVDGLRFQLAGGGHSSGNLVNLAGTTALAVVPVGTTAVAADSPVRVMLLGQ